MSKADINSIVLVGRLTRDCETRNVGGKTVLSFAVANNYYSKNDDKAHSFFDCEYWSDRVGQYLTKGKLVAIQGELRQERWNKDGQNHSRIKVIVHELQFLGSAQGSGQGQGNQDQGSASSDEDEGIPF